MSWSFVSREREREAESVFRSIKTKNKSKIPSSTTQKKHNTAGLSDASHAVSNGITSLEDPLGTVAMANHLKIDAAEFRAWNASAKTCSNASLIPKPKLSFAFQGSGQLLPFYQGVVQGLQDRGVLSPAVSKTAAFGGGSGGALTSVLTALGWPGSKQYKTFKAILNGIGKCQEKLANELLLLNFSSAEIKQEQQLQCTLNSIGLPIVTQQIKEDNPDAAAEISNRVTICEREFWLMFFVFGVGKKERRRRRKLSALSLFSPPLLFESKSQKNEKNLIFRVLPGQPPRQLDRQVRRHGNEQVEQRGRHHEQRRRLGHGECFLVVCFCFFFFLSFFVGLEKKKIFLNLPLHTLSPLFPTPAQSISGSLLYARQLLQSI